LTKNDIAVGVKAFLNIASGKSARPARLSKMTLEKNDAKIIHEYYNREENWYDEKIIKGFEADFSEKQEADYAFSFMGARVALSAIIYALGLKANDEVLVPAYTCVVVPNAFWFLGIKVHFYDIELESFGPSLESLETKLEQYPNVKAVVIHHLFGLVAKDYLPLVDLCRASGRYVIEDCAHSIGLRLNDRAVGNLGDAAFFSLEKSKIISTFNGGVATTNNKEIAEGIAEYRENASFPDKIRMLSLMDSFLYAYTTTKAPLNWITQGIISKKYKKRLLQSTTKEEMSFKQPEDYGQRMPAPLAHVGRNQLKKLERLNERRRSSTKKWAEWCDTNGFVKPLVVPNSTPVYLRYPVLVTPEMKSDVSWGKRLHTEIGVWFTSPIHPVPYKVDGCPNADEAVRRCINFPTLLS
jgi:dTDP-4-amino-4,6-dideoxygalactose transaminase